MENIRNFGQILGALVLSMGGIIEVDIATVEQFMSSEEFNAIRISIIDEKMILEVANEDQIDA